MKVLRILSMLVLAMFLAMGMFACGSSSSDSDGDGGGGSGDIVGTWQFVEIDDDSGEQINLYFEFNGDNTFEISLDSVYNVLPEGGTYTVSGDVATLTFLYDGNGDWLINTGSVPSTSDFTFSVSGDTLTVTDDEDGSEHQGTRI